VLTTEDRGRALARGRRADDTHATCRLAGFEAFLSGGISTFGDSQPSRSEFDALMKWSDASKR
jgi:hypothetical protein